MTNRLGHDLLSLPLYRHRDFNLLWTGEGVSLLGNATTTVLLPLVAVVGFGAGPGWMGVLTASAWLPWLLLGLPAGALVDGWPARRVMVLSDLSAAAVMASVPVAALLGVLTLSQLVVVAFGNGVCTVFFRAAYPALIRQVAPADRQDQAYARLYGTESAMQVVGPGLGGLLAQVGSAVWGIALDVASFLVSALCLSRIREAPVKVAAGASRTGLGKRVREGVRYICNDRLLLFLTVMGGVSNFGLTGYGALLVVFLVDDLGLEPGAIGLLTALGSVGGLVGAAIATRVSARLGSARALLWLQVLAGPPALLVPLAAPGTGVVLLVVAFVLVGVGVVAGNVIRGAWRNTYVPPEMLGRQMATAQVLNFGTMPVAALTAGWLGSQLGLVPTITGMVLVHVLACASLWWSPLRGRREMPRPVADHAVVAEA